MSEPGVRRAARFGCPWPTDPLHNIHVMKHWTDMYRAAGEEYGTTDKQQVMLLRDGWVADSMDEVERVWWPHVRAEHWFYFQQVPRWVADLEPFLADIEERRGLHVRAPPHRPAHRRLAAEDCIEQIQRFKDELDIDYLILTFRESPRARPRGGAGVHRAVRPRGHPGLPLSAADGHRTARRPAMAVGAPRTGGARRLRLTVRLRAARLQPTDW